MTKEKAKKKDVLETMFPDKEVTLPDGSKVLVTPLSLEHMPKVMRSFREILKLATQPDKDFTDIGIEAIAEVMELIPYCIDRPASEIPSASIPEIINIVIDQNVSDESLGKWKALADRMIEMQKDATTVQSQTSKK
jgi:hypothetical protein